MDTFFVFLLLFTEIILLGVAWVSFKGDFVSPSVMTLLLFILATTCFAFSTNEWITVFGFKAYSLFTSSFILMIITESFVMRHRIRITGIERYSRSFENKNYSLYISAPWNWLLFVFLISCALIYIYRVYKNGTLLGAESLLMSIGVNKEEGGFDSLSRLLFNIARMASYVYVVMFCNNVFCCKEKIKKNIGSLIIIGITLIMTFFSGQRSSPICYIVGIIVAAAISFFYRKGYSKDFDKRKFYKRLFVVAIVVVVLFYLSSNIVKGTNIQRDFISYMLYYFGSPIALMGRIVYDPELCHTPFVGYFGEKTFMGFWNTLYSWGVIPYAPADRQWINMGSRIYTGRAGNEFTFLCGPYIDFGFFGTLVFVILLYAFFALIYYRKIKENVNIYKRTTITSIYIFLYAIIAMTFYQDTIRSYSRPLNLLYILYVIVFSKLFVKAKELSTYSDANNK